VVEEVMSFTMHPGNLRLRLTPLAQMADPNS
jgi:hypothetical protein